MMNIKKPNSNALQKLLTTYREKSLTEREKGTYFECLTKTFLENDAAYKDRFNTVYHYTDWAKKRGISEQDTGIDLVAETSDNAVYAIQCKFYQTDHAIQKKDLDSFFTASGKSPFTNRLFVDSTMVGWSQNAKKAMHGQYIPVQRLTIPQMEESNIDWSQYTPDTPITFVEQLTLKEHQIQAIEKVHTAFQTTDRGKLIMACGTGKTLTSLRIAERIAGEGKHVLYLVPSLALISQTIRAWANDKNVNMTGFAVCSDSKVGKHNNNDTLSITTHDLAYPATTNPEILACKVQEVPHDKMTVIFSTYQSIDVIAQAQSNHHMHEFDLVICDEAHRTTGATLSGDKESHFVKVHNQQYLKAKKRLYMTATPRVYSSEVQNKAKETDAFLASMDDTTIFGDVLHEVTFNYAVEHKLLSDYKVIVFAFNETLVEPSIQKLCQTNDYELNLEDTTKIIGCYKALCKIGFKKEDSIDSTPMHRAVAFCKDIKTSKNITKRFSEIIAEYRTQVVDNSLAPMMCESQHIDGTFNAKQRKVALDWLENPNDTCKILSNVRCLSEGVDVPTLDAVMFLHPRKSQVDVVQSVGRVMRTAKNKKLGYVILPVTIPAGMEPEEALENNEKYKVIWQVLNALRSHDERLSGTINRARLGDNIESKIEIIATSNTLPQQNTHTQNTIGNGVIISDYKTIPPPPPPPQTYTNNTLDFGDTVNKAIMAKLVKKCGTRTYWEDWATDIAHIAKTHINRITAITSQGQVKETLQHFVRTLQSTLNPTISQESAIEMIAQHIITKPIFDMLFEDYEFTKHNAVSQAMENIIYTLQDSSLKPESKTLHTFYASVQRRVQDIQSIKAKQAIIIELYDTFFKKTFPRVAEALGIVYTPVAVVDFIIHSINHVLTQEFNTSLGAKNVNILDPFTGTGTFITRLLQSRLIPPQTLPYKYKHEIYANEIILLAYYIASINIEQVYHDIIKEPHYTPYNGICLADTFQTYENQYNKQQDLTEHLMLMHNNTQRIEHQKKQPIQVIMSNPPYSAGQRSANDNNQNTKYPHLDHSIEDTYARHSTATNKNSLYDSYIRAIKWGSTRLGDTGIIGYITNASFIDGNAMAGLRKCLAEEYTHIYIYNLRGNIRKDIQTQHTAGEGGNVFDVQVPVAITILVKNPASSIQGTIHYHDIGDNLSKDEKLQAIEHAKSIDGIQWNTIYPNTHHDWIEQRNDSFYNHIPMGDKATKGKPHTVAIFSNYSRGLATSRDAWCYNSSKQKLSHNINSTIDFYNSEVARYWQHPNTATQNIRDMVSMDSTKISWSDKNLQDVQKNKHYCFTNTAIVQATYRPFYKQWAYYHKDLNARTYQLPKIFPMGTSLPNTCICVSGVGASSFSVHIVNTLPDLSIVNASQCFPLHFYESNTDTLQASPDGYTKHDNITHYAHQHFAYNEQQPSKEDIFYYIYAILHSPHYTTMWNYNLTKTLPHIPKTKTYTQFNTFSQAGRALAQLHLNYDTVPMYPAHVQHQHNETASAYHVQKMKFATYNTNKDYSTIIYNQHITITNIPPEAYEYKINNKSAIEWVMDKQSIKTDKNSGINNNANDYANDTMHNPKYPLELLLRIITVSMESMKIIKALPPIET